MLKGVWQLVFLRWCNDFWQHLFHFWSCPHSWDVSPSSKQCVCVEGKEKEGKDGPTHICSLFIKKAKAFLETPAEFCFCLLCWHCHLAPEVARETGKSRITLFQTLQWIREGEKKVEKGVRLGSHQWQPPVHVILMKTLPNRYCDVSPFYKWGTKTWRSYENWPRSNNWKMREQGSTQVVCLQSLFTSQLPHYSVETKPQADSTQCLPVWVVFHVAS